MNAVDATSPVSHFWFNHERNRVHFAMVIPALFHDVVRENEIGNLIAQRPQRTAVLGFRKVPIVPAVANVPIVKEIRPVRAIQLTFGAPCRINWRLKWPTHRNEEF